VYECTENVHFGQGQESDIIQMKGASKYFCTINLLFASANPRLGGGQIHNFRSGGYSGRHQTGEGCRKERYREDVKKTAGTGLIFVPVMGYNGTVRSP